MPLSALGQRAVTSGGQTSPSPSAAGLPPGGGETGISTLTPVESKPQRGRGCWAGRAGRKAPRSREGHRGGGRSGGRAGREEETGRGRARGGRAAPRAWTGVHLTWRLEEGRGSRVGFILVAQQSECLKFYFRRTTLPHAAWAAVSRRGCKWAARAAASSVC